MKVRTSVVVLAAVRRVEVMRAPPAQSGPERPRIAPSALRCVRIDLLARAGLETTVTGIVSRQAFHRGIGKARVRRPFEEQGQILRQMRLVVLDGRHVVGVLLPNPAHCRLLAMQGVGGNETAVEIQQGQQSRDGGDLVGLLVDLALRQHQTVAFGEDADYMHRRPRGRGIEGVAQLLAVDADLLSLGVFWGRQTQGAHPFEKHGGERFRIEADEAPAEGVGAGNAGAHVEGLGRPVVLGFGEFDHILPAFPAAEDRADADDQDIDERMHPASGNPGIRKGIQAFGKGQVHNRRPLLR